ncbi:hypothetical protein LSTR_LSTR009966 [Laodelphax striatellus]|uniref:Uncharacterized protein n=1 Tax=Laodelphax striatellus TaxID=195883 RepID=A0A482XGP4_LAOST|nr:hypothetical protein LSTR_LSTR009966 [Laodelphax striatellus]
MTESIHDAWLFPLVKERKNDGGSCGKTEKKEIEKNRECCSKNRLDFPLPGCRYFGGSLRAESDTSPREGSYDCHQYFICVPDVSSLPTCHTFYLNLNRLIERVFFFETHRPWLFLKGCSLPLDFAAGNMKRGGRDAGSITSANFDPENLRQLSSTAWNQRSSDGSASSTPSPTTVNHTTQLSPDELSPLTSRLMNDTPTDLVTLMLKLSNDLKDSQEKLGSRMDSRMEKMDRELKEDMKQMNNQIEKMDGGLRGEIRKANEEIRGIKGEMKDMRKQLDDTTVCLNKRMMICR